MINKKVLVWKGELTPPNSSFLWLKEKDLLTYNEETNTWDKIVSANTSLNIKEEVDSLDNKIQVIEDTQNKKLIKTITVTNEDENNKVLSITFNDDTSISTKFKDIDTDTDIHVSGLFYKDGILTIKLLDIENNEVVDKTFEVDLKNDNIFALSSLIPTWEVTE